MIRKYHNRRLYDTELADYVTCEEIELRIRAGETPSVECQKTNSDVTAEVYARIVIQLAERGAVDPQQLWRLIRKSRRPPETAPVPE